MTIDKRVFATTLLLSCAVALPLARYLVPDASAKGSHSHGVERYQCPMHPSVVQDREGSCPICGMKLVAARAGAPAAEGAVVVPPEKQGTVGITVAAVSRAGGTRTVRAPGRVTPDEARLYRINAGVEGSFRDVAAAATTGSRVRKSQILASFYAPAAINTIQVFILNTTGHDRAAAAKKSGSLDGENLALINSNLQQRLIQFESLGISERQREEIWKTRKVPDTIQVVSPVDGFVLARNASPGLKFERAMELFRVADLRRVWVVADVFPDDAQYVRAGMTARISVPGLRTPMTGTVSDALPQFDPGSRTSKVRIELDNPGFALRPEMLVDVEVSADLPEMLTVPIDAIVDTGLTRIVFVATAAGTFMQRAVQTGLRNGDRIEIVSGLSPTERIATSGVFFLDSETRMRPTASDATASRLPAPDPTGQRTSSGGAGSSPEVPTLEGAAHPDMTVLR